MAVFKCKMCGGSLEVRDGITVAECEYCGTKQTLPKSRDEIVSNLFSRANNLRLKCEFDKAEQVYEKILDIDNSEPEAHWGIVLCKYGIEYVEDPKTYSRIPTCHRTLYEAVLTDVNYLSATQNADEEQRELYIAEAKIIDELQKNILNIVNSEKPFDVFICYKETDENGKRTVDSAIANDIYYQLTQEGFKVFYAPITLEDKLGHEYEPYIFAALNSAKVMLVVGTKPEYFDSVWVRNEWSRFLKLMKADRSKLLIPCYRDMDAYELPDEFAHLQAQDMGKIGFINDVIRGLKKVFDRDEQPQKISNTKREKRNKPQSKFSKFIEKRRAKRKEKAKYCLVFPLKNFAKYFYVFTIIIGIYFSGIEMSESGSPMAITMVSLILSAFVPSLIFLKILKNKIISIILQIPSVFFIGCYCLIAINDGEIGGIEGKYTLFLVFSFIYTLVWFVILCFIKRIECINTKKTKNLISILIGVITSAFLIVALEFGGLNFSAYHFAKVLYNCGYDYRAEYIFHSLYDYKDSEQMEQECIYSRGIRCLNEQEYKSAANVFEEIPDYKDSNILATNAKLKEIKMSEELDQIEIGKTKEEWMVVKKEENKVLLILKYSSYFDGNILGGWKKCSLRTCLNGEFYKNNFSDEIKKYILTTTLTTKSSTTDITKDKIFILSTEEFKNYLLYRNQSMISEGQFFRDNNGDTYYRYTGIIAEANYTRGISSDVTMYSNFENYVNRLENEGIERCLVCPAMWIDVSGIE